MGSSMRKERKSKREKERRSRQMQTLLVVLAAVLVLAAVIIIPSVIQARTPVGDIVQITPHARPMADGTAMGDPNAPVRVDVFEDFQCPVCKQFTENTEPLLIENYISTGKVYYVFHEFPFLDSQSVTKESQQAANASECAAAQGRFWDYHDILFANWNGENQGAFTDKRLVAFAESINLDMNQFNSCFNGNQYKPKINQDLALGKSLGVSGTPSVFVNNQAVKPGYVPSYDDLRQAIDTALAGG